MYNDILVNLPTNIGDAVMALPVIDKLHANYETANVSAICSNRTIEFIRRHNFIKNVILYDKRSTLREKISFSLSLRGKYDLMVDLKNSLLPIFAGSNHTSFFRNFPKNMHSKDIYLSLIEKFAPKQTSEKGELIISKEEKEKWDAYRFSPSVFVACASNSGNKRYPYKCLKETIQKLKIYGKVILIGQEQDKSFYNDILCLDNVIDLTGKTKIHEVFYLIKNYARVVICVDSSILHIASYCCAPIIGLFGQTSTLKYGPWSKKFITLKRNDLPCVPCQKPGCNHNHECMDIAPDEIINATERLLKFL
ncbi:MAG: glycosyltransferase family 9 protein [Candidatus Omnitrophota bacterium]|jgi:ADP-heptose:LPS heptosyltransferase